MYHYDDQDRLIAETTQTGTLLRSYAWSDENLIGQVEYVANATNTGYEVGRIVYYELDHLGTPRQARERTGTVVWRWESDGYGTTPADEDPDGNGQLTKVYLRFPGQYYDEESGLHYNWHRYYVPRVGRYLSSDPIGIEGGINSYLYAEANPLMYTDPLGMFSAADLPSIPQPVVDFSAGLGDALLLGTGGYLRDWAGIDGGVDPCSDAYDYGAIAALAAGGARVAYAGLAKAGSVVASSGAQASAFRSRLKTFFRGGVGRNWRPPNLAGKTDAQLRASAGKTNFGVNAYGAGVGAAGGIGAAQCGCPK